MDTRTQATVCCWPEGRGCGGWVKVSKEGNGDICDGVNNKNEGKKKKKRKSILG